LLSIQLATAALVVLDQLVGDSPAAKAFLPLLFPPLLLRYFAAGGAGSSARARLPPSPPAGLPLIGVGHAHLVGAIPHVSLRRLAARQRGCADLMTVRLGAVDPTLVASSAHAARAVLRTHDQALASRARSACVDVLTYGPSDVVFAPYGERWRRSKRLVTTHLHMFAAGTDTTYLVLEFTMAELMLHPEAMAKLQAEVRMLNI